MSDTRIPGDAGPFQRFLRKFVSGSYPLFAAAAAALLWANLSPHTYHAVWHTELTISFGTFQIAKSLAHWIDEALMTLFFFVVGLEIKREFLVGGLSSPKQAALPIAAAVGGMLVPAAIYVSLNAGTEALNGWGIAMATDIAFSLAILGLLGKKIPIGLKLFLSAFAIADDLGAVAVIAAFYTPAIKWIYLTSALGFMILLFAANRLWIRHTLVYVVLGAGLWFSVMGSGVHATVAGVLVAMFIPARGKYDTDTFVKTVNAELDKITCQEDGCGFSILMNRQHLDAVQNMAIACEAVETPLQRLEHGLQAWVAFAVLPLFALANAGLALGGLDMGSAVLHPVTLGIVLGLVIGKPLGITLFAYLSVKLFKAQLPQSVRWRHMLGTGFLGGIGFTMSLFISGLSFSQADFSQFAKLGILTASLASGIFGYLILRAPAQPR
jgi:NhaA family Na+:H+ antiporter